MDFSPPNSLVTAGQMIAIYNTHHAASPTPHIEWRENFKDTCIYQARVVLFLVTRLLEIRLEYQRLLRSIRIHFIHNNLSKRKTLVYSALLQ